MFDGENGFSNGRPMSFKFNAVQCIVNTPFSETIKRSTFKLCKKTTWQIFDFLDMHRSRKLGETFKTFSPTTLHALCMLSLCTLPLLSLCLRLSVCLCLSVCLSLSFSFFSGTSRFCLVLLSMQMVAIYYSFKK